MCPVERAHSAEVAHVWTQIAAWYYTIVSSQLVQSVVCQVELLPDGATMQSHVLSLLTTEAGNCMRAMMFLGGSESCTRGSDATSPESNPSITNLNVLNIALGLRRAPCGFSK
jgi:hypothetical protein